MDFLGYNVAAFVEKGYWMKRLKKLPVWGYALIVIIGIGLLIIAGPTLLRLFSLTQSNSAGPIRAWFSDASVRPELMTIRNREACPNAPFILPSDGFIGLLYRDPIGPYNIFRRHTGIDIFGDGAPGEVPVYAAYDGWLTRLEDWFATVIIRHDDPLQSGRTIWTYYTHMGARDGSESYIVADFPPGTYDKPVKQGDLLGYQGEFSGSGPPVGLHVHFSIVLSELDGSFKNEAILANTLDPSPYLGMNVNIDSWPERPIDCE